MGLTSTYKPRQMWPELSQSGSEKKKKEFGSLKKNSKNFKSHGDKWEHNPFIKLTNK